MTMKLFRNRDNNRFRVPKVLSDDFTPGIDSSLLIIRMVRTSGKGNIDYIQGLFEADAKGVTSTLYKKGK